MIDMIGSVCGIVEVKLFFCFCRCLGGKGGMKGDAWEQLGMSLSTVISLTTTV